MSAPGRQAIPSPAPLFCGSCLGVQQIQHKSDTLNGLGDRDSKAYLPMNRNMRVNLEKNTD